MTSSPPDTLRRRRPLAGFTMVELMMASTIASFVLVGILTAFLMLLRSGIRVSNYSMMESQTRRAFEQLGIDARMANNFASTFTGNAITSFTLTIPSEDLSAQRTVTYGFDTSSSTNQILFMVPGTDPTVTTGRVNLVTNVSSLTFLRYDATGTLIPASTTSDAGVKHVQISVTVSRSQLGVMAASQVIRSSAFTLRNISI